MSFIKAELADGSKASLDLLKDTVGFTGKNQAFSQANNAVIAHIENGKAYKVSWTGSATVTLKKDSSSGTQVATGSTSPLTFTADSAFDLYFGSSADVTSIMVYDASISDESFEDYHDSVETMFEEEIHGVNLFDNSQAPISAYQNAAGASTTNGVRVTNSQSSTNSFVRYKVDLDSNKKYILSTNVVVSSGTPALFVQGYNGTQWVNIVSKNGVSGRIKEEFDTTGYIDFQMNLFCTASTSESGNVLYDNLMIYEADLEVSDYKPYNPQSIQHQLNAQTGVLGAKNLLEVTAGTVAQGGVTLTVDSKGIATLSGKSTSSTNYFNIGIVHVKRDVAYTLNGGLSDDANDGSQRLFANSTTAFGSGNRLMSCDDGVGRMTRVALADEDVTIQLQIMNTSKTYIASSDIIKPMIRLAPDPDDTFVPHAMTNRELTELAVFDGGDLTSSHDLNNIIKQGIYHFTTLPSHAPTGTEYCPLLVLARNSTNLQQVIVAAGSIYVRYYGGNPANWSSWFKYTGTVVS